MSDAKKLSQRIVIQIRLALSRQEQDSPAATHLYNQAKRAGLTQAEIDAARSGRSFEARACAAIRLAKAIIEEDAKELLQAQAHAAEFGLCPIEILQVEKLALRIKLDG